MRFRAVVVLDVLRCYALVDGVEGFPWFTPQAFCPKKIVAWLVAWPHPPIRIQAAYCSTVIMVAGAAAGSSSDAITSDILYQPCKTVHERWPHLSEDQIRRLIFVRSQFAWRVGWGRGASWRALCSSKANIFHNEGDISQTRLCRFKVDPAPSLHGSHEYARIAFVRLIQRHSLRVRSNYFSQIEFNPTQPICI